MAEDYTLKVKVDVDAGDFDSKIEAVKEKLRGAGDASDTSGNKMAAFGDKVSKAGSKIQSAGKKITVMGAAAVALGTKLVKAAEEAEQSQTKLTEVMRAMMGATDDEVASINKLIDAEAESGVVGKTVQRNGAQQLATYLHNKDALEKLVPAMNDLVVQQKGVNATGGDAINIANMMGKVFSGQVGALRRAGISFDEYQEEVLKSGTEMEKAAMLAEVINQNVGDMNQAMAETDSGKIAKAKQELAAVSTTVGSALLPVVADAASYLSQKLLPKIQELADKFKNNDSAAKITAMLGAFTAVGGPALVMIGKITSGVGSLIGSISKMHGVGQAAFSAMAANPYLAIAAGVAAVAAGVYLLYEHSKRYTNEAEAFIQANKEQEESIAMQAEKSRMYADMLDELMSKEEKSAEDKQKIKAIVDNLNESQEGLNLTYDEEKDKLNMSKKAIDEKIASMEKEALAEAYKKQMQEAADKAVQNSLTLKEKEAELSELLAKKKQLEAEGNYKQAQDLDGAINARQRDIENLKEAGDTYESEMQRIAEASSDAASQSEKAGKKVPKSMAEGIESNKGTATSAAKRTASDTAKNMKTDARPQGQKGAQSYAAGVASGAGAAGKAGTALKNRAESGAKGGDFRSKGHDAASGYASGILSGLGAVGRAASSLVSTALAKIKAAQKSNSPAKMTMYLGDDASAGYALGFERGLPKVRASAAGMVKHALDSIDIKSKEIETTAPKSAYQISNASGFAARAAGQGGKEVSKVVNIPVNMTVNGAQDPEAFASTFAASLKLNMRSA